MLSLVTQNWHQDSTTLLPLMEMGAVCRGGFSEGRGGGAGWSAGGNRESDDAPTQPAPPGLGPAQLLTF
jgi:hypothetical protein